MVGKNKVANVSEQMLYLCTDAIHKGYQCFLSAICSNPGGPRPNLQSKTEVNDD